MEFMHVPYSQEFSHLLSLAKFFIVISFCSVLHVWRPLSHWQKFVTPKNNYSILIYEVGLILVIFLPSENFGYTVRNCQLKLNTNLPIFFLTGSAISSPYYSVVKDKSIYKSYTYDREAKEHVFTVEKDSHFHLKLDISGNPAGSEKCSLQKLGEEKLKGVALAAFKYDVDLVDIQIVSKQHEDSYVIKAFSKDGEAMLQFRLIVEGIHACY